MNLLDGGVVVALAAGALGGWRSGVVSKAAASAGVVAGFTFGSVAAPPVLRRFELSSASGRTFVVVAVLVTATFAGHIAGLVAGRRLRAALAEGPGRVRPVDRRAGVAAGIVGVAVMGWLALPVVADSAGRPPRLVEGSALAGAADSKLPPAPDLVRAVRRLAEGRAVPMVFGGGDDAPAAGEPSATARMRPEVAAQVAASTVEVTAQGCRRVRQGSGFVVADGAVVTAAHVVAGQDRVEVVRPDGRRLKATVAVFDRRRDLAVLRVPDLGLDKLTRGVAGAGLTGTVFGYPAGEDALRAVPATITDEVTAAGADLYGASVKRQVYVLAARLGPGYSGAPFVDRGGQVGAVAFAVSPEHADTAYALTRVELDAVVAAYSRTPSARASTQACLG